MTCSTSIPLAGKLRASRHGLRLGQLELQQPFPGRAERDGEEILGALQNQHITPMQAGPVIRAIPEYANLGLMNMKIPPAQRRLRSCK